MLRIWRNRFAVAAKGRLAHSRRAMRILLTNDDGVNARGLALLEKVARRLSDDIWIVAPAEEQSGTGHSLTLSRPAGNREEIAPYAQQLGEFFDPRR